MSSVYLSATVMVFCLTGNAMAQTAPPAPAPSSAEAIIRMQIDAGGAKSASGTSSADEADAAYKRYIADIGRPMSHGAISGGSPSGPSTGFGAR